MFIYFLLLFHDIPYFPSGNSIRRCDHFLIGDPPFSGLGGLWTRREAWVAPSPQTQWTNTQDLDGFMDVSRRMPKDAEGCRRMPKDAHGFWWFTMTKLRTVIFHSEITGHSKFANNDRPRFVCVPTGFVWKYTPFHQLLYLLEELSFNFGQSQLVSTPLGWPRTTRFLEVMVTAAEALPFLQCRWWVGKQGFQLTQETDGDAAGEVFGMGGFN